MKTIFTLTYVQLFSCQHILFTIWFKNSIFFSIFYFIRDFLWLFFMVFSIFHSFFGCMTWMHVTCPFQWVGYISGGRHDWLPWISWLKSSCSNHFQPPQWSSCIVTDESYAFRPFRQKIMRNIEIIRYSSEWNRNRERDAFIEPDGQQYIAERPYCHVSTVIQKNPMVFIIRNILPIGKRFYWS